MSAGPWISQRAEGLRSLAEYHNKRTTAVRLNSLDEPSKRVIVEIAGIEYAETTHKACRLIAMYAIKFG
jgi:hypothetical protein